MNPSDGSILLAAEISEHRHHGIQLLLGIVLALAKLGELQLLPALELGGHVCLLIVLERLDPLLVAFALALGILLLLEEQEPHLGEFGGVSRIRFALLLLLRVCGRDSRLPAR